MKSDERVIIVLAHPDDEVFCQHLLKKFQNHQLTFIYLTNGSPTNNLELVRIREDESRTAISLIAEGAEIFPYGRLMEITDGKLARQFTKADLSRIIDFIGLGTGPSVFISPTLEGGHQDHDATFLITDYLSRHWGAKHYAFPLYSSARLPLPFFSTMKKANDYESFNQTLKTRLLFLNTTLKLFLIHKSQKKTWMGLALPTLFHFVVASPVIITSHSRNIADIEKLLYEYRGNETRLTLQIFQDNLFREL